MCENKQEVSPEYLTFMTRLRRKRNDRRMLYGRWSRYQIRKGAIVSPSVTPHESEDWVLVRYGDLWFPSNAFTARREILKIGFRRALHARYPTHRFPKTGLMWRWLKGEVDTSRSYQRPLAAMDGIQWGKPYISRRSDPETPYMDYSVYFSMTHCGQHAIKLELDSDKVLTTL